MCKFTSRQAAFLLTAVVGVFVLGSGCPQGPLVDQTVTVAAEGGRGEVTFNGTAGQTIRITLVGTPDTMQPYGLLHSPTGAVVEAPPMGTAAGGRDEATVTLTETGRFTYPVFDGANLGGTVAVRIELIPG